MECLREDGQAALFQRFRQARSARDYGAIQKIQEEIAPMVDERMEGKEEYTFSEEQKLAYASVGGAPHLDGAYTVFGEVVEGLEVVDKIAAVKTNGASRPIENVIMSMKLVKK